MASGHPFLAKLGPGGTDSPRFGMVQDCLWDSKEQYRKWTAQLISAPRFCMGPDCLWKARSNSSELSCTFSVLLLAVPEAVSSNTKMRRRSIVQSILGTNGTHRKYLKKYFKVLKVTYEWHIDILTYQYQYVKYRDCKCEDFGASRSTVVFLNND